MEELFCGHKSMQMLLLLYVTKHFVIKAAKFYPSLFFYALIMLALLIENNRMSKNQASVILLLCPFYLLSVSWSYFSSPSLSVLMAYQIGSLTKGGLHGSGNPTKNGISIFQSNPLFPVR